GSGAVRSAGRSKASSCRSGRASPAPWPSRERCNGVDCPSIYPSSTVWQYASGFVAPNGFREYCFSAVAGTAYECATCNRADFDTVVEVRDDPGRSVLAYTDDYCARQSDLARRAPSSV